MSGVQVPPPLPLFSKTCVNTIRCLTCSHIQKTEVRGRSPQSTLECEIRVAARLERRACEFSAPSPRRSVPVKRLPSSSWHHASELALGRCRWQSARARDGLLRGRTRWTHPSRHGLLRASANARWPMTIVQAVMSVVGWTAVVSSGQLFASGRADLQNCSALQK